MSLFPMLDAFAILIYNGHVRRLAPELVLVSARLRRKQALHTGTKAGSC